MMHKNSYLSVNASYQEQLVLDTIKEMPTMRNKDKQQDELFTRVLGKLEIPDRVNMLILCIQRGRVS